MAINITAGDCLNALLSKKYPGEVFIPFREAMIEGPCSFEPFSLIFLRSGRVFTKRASKLTKSICEDSLMF